MEPIRLIETGLANIASVESAFARIGMNVIRTTDPEFVLSADRVILPGVGAFGAAMPFLRSKGLDEAICERVREGRPTLAICLGFQLLAEASEEAQGVAGLGCISGTIKRLPATEQVPQLGWNRVTPSEPSTMVREGYAYFANSYCLTTPPAGWIYARTPYGVPLVSAIERGRVLGCQFHPELSGAWGQELLSRWVNGGGASC